MLISRHVPVICLTRAVPPHTPRPTSQSPHALTPPHRLLHRRLKHPTARKTTTKRPSPTLTTTRTAHRAPRRTTTPPPRLVLRRTNHHLASTRSATPPTSRRRCTRRWRRLFATISTDKTPTLCTAASHFLHTPPRISLIWSCRTTSRSLPRWSVRASARLVSSPLTSTTSTGKTPATSPPSSQASGRRNWRTLTCSWTRPDFCASTPREGRRSAAAARCRPPGSPPGRRVARPQAQPRRLLDARAGIDSDQAWTEPDILGPAQRRAQDGGGGPERL
ncbi:hypothetical protein T484DRAFT_3562492, partial [Baffinella frigidus]